MAEPSTKFAIVSWEHKWEQHQLAICCTTDILCHLWLAFTWTPTRLHMRSDFQRGYGWHWYPKFCFVEYIWQEQLQKGDTLFHSFASFGGDPELSAAFVFIGYVNTTLCTSKIGFIKSEYDEQGEAPELDPPTLYDFLKWLPWQENVRDFGSYPIGIWDLTLLTGTAVASHREWGLQLANGADANSMCIIRTQLAGGCTFRHDLASQLRANFFPYFVTAALEIFVVHGSPTIGSGYGFRVRSNRLYGWCRNPASFTSVDLGVTFSAYEQHLCEAKYRPGHSVEFWVDSVYRGRSTTNLPTTENWAARADFMCLGTPGIGMCITLFQIWQQSPFSGGYQFES